MNRAHATWGGIVVAVLATLLVAVASEASPMKIEAVMTPKEQIRLDFADGSKHFVLMVKREGKAAGDGVLNGASVTEYGDHDITPGVGGDPRGYLVFTMPGGDIAYVKWRVRAVFVRGPEGKPMLLDNGIWEVAGGTGKFGKLSGAGTLHIKPAPGADRRFILEGDLITAP
ncbi:MAG: hypothetical protein ACM3OG_04475 [Actinomycetota bacterium]